MKKNYVTDSSFMMADPSAIKKLRGNNVLIPMVVLEELDKHKKGNEEKNKAVREVIRFLDKAREKGSLQSGVYLPEYDIKLKVVLSDPNSNNLKLLIENGQDRGYTDNLILAICLDLLDEAKARHRARPILLTKDIALRVKAGAVGVVAEDFRETMVKEEVVDENPVVTIDAADTDVDLLYQDKFLEVDHGFEMNTLLVVSGDSKSALARVISPTRIKLVSPPKVYGLSSKNKEQAFAIDLLLDPEVEIVVLQGPAGTGKSIIALAAGLEQVVNMSASSGRDTYNKVMATRIPVAMGKDIGYLPGGVDEKLAHWMSMVSDNFEVLTSMGKQGKVSSKDAQRILADLQNFGKFEVLPTTYIRGRSIPKSYIIVEEAQNTTTHEIKSIVSRAGKGTKLVILGDPGQIDVPYLDRYNNGLSYLVDRMMKDEEGRRIMGYVRLDKSERSRVAEVTGRVL